MLRAKKLSAAILALSSSLAFAGTMGPVCTPENVTVPCERSAWDFGIQALYVQQTFNDNLSYLGRYVLPIDNVVTSTYVDNDIRWGWGFKLEGSYHFNTGNDLTINWYHASDNKRTQGFPSNFAIANERLLFGTDNNFLTTDPKWDAVNIEFGQHVDFGKRTNIRYHGGLHYANLKFEAGAKLFNNDGTFSINAVGDSKVNLIGPRMGIDTSYYLAKGLSIYANGAFAMLVGDQDFRSTAELPPALGGQTLIQSGNKNIVSPQMEGKLGLKYGYPLAQGTLIADGGYMWVNYFNAITSTINSSTNIDSSDYAVHGAYFGLKWIGTIA